MHLGPHRVRTFFPRAVGGCWRRGWNGLATTTLGQWKLLLSLAQFFWRKELEICPFSSVGTTEAPWTLEMLASTGDSGWIFRSFTGRRWNSPSEYCWVLVGWVARSGQRQRVPSAHDLEVESWRWIPYLRESVGRQKSTPLFPPKCNIQNMKGPHGLCSQKFASSFRSTLLCEYHCKEFSL